MAGGRRRVVGVLLAGALAAGCAGQVDRVVAGLDPAAVEVTPTTAATTTTSTTTTTTTTTTVAPTTVSPATAAPATAPPPEPAPAQVATPPTEPPPPPPPPAPRAVHEQAWTPFAVVGDVVLHHPSARVELIGFHEATHDGSQDQAPLDTAAPHAVLDSRNRGTGARSAADIVADPGVEIRAPVTGRVVRGGTYVLYCDHTDGYVVIEPDARPGWEVKVLHVQGVAVRSGDRVVAGETVIAAHPTMLPFRSQVDDLTADPSWPHVHVDVVDPSIPTTPKGPGC